LVGLEYGLQGRKGSTHATCSRKRGMKNFLKRRSGKGGEGKLRKKKEADYYVSIREGIEKKKGKKFN